MKISVAIIFIIIAASHADAAQASRRNDGYIPLDTVLPAGCPPPVHDPLARSYTYEIGGRLMLVVGFDRVFHNSTVVNLTKPVRLIDDRLFIAREDLEAIAAIADTEQTPPPLPAPGLPEREPSHKPLIVIDAGHGGRDPGAIANGLVEKEITLSISLKLRDLLESSGYSVTMTRADDTFVELDERIAIANRAQADLFISIHANHESSGVVEGVEVFRPDADSRFNPIVRGAAVAKSGGYSSKLNGIECPPSDPLAALLTGLQIEDARYRSIKAATIIERMLCHHVAATSRGVKPGPFRVLRLATCPAVLVEVGFLSNRNEAKRLAEKEYHQRVAEGLARSISTIFKNEFQQ